LAPAVTVENPVAVVGVSETAAAAAAQREKRELEERAANERL